LILASIAGENDLKEGQLLVLSAANHKDERRVAYLWDSIVDESYARTSGDMRAGMKPPPLLLPLPFSLFLSLPFSFWLMFYSVVAKVVLLTTSMATKTNDYIPVGLLLDTLERYSLYLFPLYYSLCLPVLFDVILI
jgi:hypothetical protein